MPKACQVNELTLEDVTTGNTPSKLETTDGYIFCVLSYHHRGVWGRLAMILTDKLIVTIHQSAMPLIMEAVQRLHMMRISTMTVETVFYTILDVAIDTKCARLLVFQDEVDELADRVFDMSLKDRADILLSLTTSRRKATELRTMMTTAETIVKTVLSKQFSTCFIMRQNYLDILDNVSQALQRIESTREVISQANNNVVSILSIIGAEHSNRTNDVMKRMTLLGSVMGPLNLVTSAFGMNIRVPYQQEDSTTLFWVLVGCALGWVCFMGMLYAFFRRSDENEKKLSSVVV